MKRLNGKGAPAHRGPSITLLKSGDGVALCNARGRTIATLTDAQAAKRALARYPESRTRVVIPIESEQVLLRPVELPSAAAENLRQVLFLQMGQVTPFAAEDVVYSADVRAAGSRNATMQVDLKVAPKRLVEPQREALLGAGYELPWDRARIENHGDGNAVVFTPPARRGAAYGFYGAVWLVNAALLGALVGWPFYEQHRALVALEQAMVQARPQAEAAAALRDQLERLTEEVEALRLLGPRSPSAVQLIDEVAMRLPDSTWVEQLLVKDGKLTLRGVSTEAPQLIGLLDASPYLREASLKSALTAARGQTGERFVISADVVYSPASKER